MRRKSRLSLFKKNKFALINKKNYLNKLKSYLGIS